MNIRSDQKPQRAAIRRFGARLAVASYIAAAAGVAPAAGAPAPGFVAPICANGDIRYIIIELGGEQDAPPSDDHPSACHSPCMTDRRIVVLSREQVRV